MAQGDFGLVTVPLMNRGLDDPDVMDGWIGAILLVVTMLFLLAFGWWNKKRNDRVSALAKAEHDHKAAAYEAEQEPLVRDDVY